MSGLTILEDRVVRHAESRPLKTYVHAIQSMDDADLGIGILGEELLHDAETGPCRIDALTRDFLNNYPGDELKTEKTIINILAHAFEFPPPPP